MPNLVGLLMRHRPPKLRGRSLLDVARLADRTPQRLDEIQARWGSKPERMRTASPVLVFAVVGQARARGSITPEREATVLRRMLTYWALRSSLGVAAPIVAGQPVPYRRFHGLPARAATPDRLQLIS
jgi:hypothetical protein